MNNDLRRLMELSGIIHRSEKLLKEGEGGDDAADLFDDAGGDEEEAGGDEGGDEGGEAEGGGDKEDDKKEEEEEEEVEVLSASEISKYGTGEFESEIDQIFTGIFDQAMGRAKVRSEKSIGYPGKVEEIEESRKYKLSSMLFESEALEQGSQEFDLVYFTNEVARYINNYTTLLDIEGMLFSKAKQFLLNQRSPEEADMFEELLAKDHDLTFSDAYEDPEEDTPVAVGAKSEA